MVREYDIDILLYVRNKETFGLLRGKGKDMRKGYKRNGKDFLLIKKVV